MFSIKYSFFFLFFFVVVSEVFSAPISDDPPLVPVTKTSKKGKTTKTVTTAGDEDTEVKTITISKTKKNGDVITRTKSSLIEKGDDLGSKKDDAVIRTNSKTVTSKNDCGDIVTTGTSKTRGRSGAEATDNKITSVGTVAETSVTGDAEATATSNASLNTNKKGATRIKGTSQTSTIVKAGSDSTATAAGGVTTNLQPVIAY